MPSIKINVRLQPSQVYELEKIAKYFHTNSSTVIRNCIDDYIEIFWTWQSRLNSPEIVTPKGKP